MAEKDANRYLQEFNAAVDSNPVIAAAMRSTPTDGSLMTRITMDPADTLTWILGMLALHNRWLTAVLRALPPDALPQVQDGDLN